MGLFTFYVSRLTNTGASMFDFINRKLEFQTLQDSFVEHVLHDRSCLSYLILFINLGGVSQ